MNGRTDELITHPSLLLRVRNARDNGAWNEFVEVYGPLIFSYCRLRRIQESDAADVAQEVLMRLASALRQFEYQPELGRFRDWLGTVTHRELLRFWGRQRAMQSLPESDSAGGAPTTEDVSQWTEHFQAELLRLSLERIRSEFTDQTWGAFQLAWFENLSPADVASKLGIGIEKVYVAKSRVLKRLRDEVLRLSEDLPVANL